jgi:hypothetical protein
MTRSPLNPLILRVCDFFEVSTILCRRNCFVCSNRFLATSKKSQILSAVWRCAKRVARRSRRTCPSPRRSPPLRALSRRLSVSLKPGRARVPLAPQYARQDSRLPAAEVGLCQPAPPILPVVIPITISLDLCRSAGRTRRAEYNAQSTRSSKPLVTWIVACIKLSRL